MNLSFGIVFLWLTFMCFYVAFKKGSATTPTEVIQELITAITGGGPPTASTDPGVTGYFLGMAPGQLAGSIPQGASGGTALDIPDGESGGTGLDVPDGASGGDGLDLLPGASGGRSLDLPDGASGSVDD